MTGVNGVADTAKTGVCPMCGGMMATGGQTDIPFRMKKGVLLVRGVPAEICGDCGEPYLDSEVMDRISEIAREFDAIETEISVVRYRAA